MTSKTSMWLLAALLHCLRNSNESATINDCQLSVDTNDWTVSGNCQIQDIFTSDGVYDCIWYQSSYHQEMPSKYWSTPFIDQHFSGSSELYKSGRCEMKIQLPEEQGIYSYELQFTSETKRTLVGTLPMSPPKALNISKCKTFVSEHDTSSCDCTTTDPGYPPAVRKWSGFSGEHLVVPDVQRDMNGTIYNCTQIWNGHVYGTAAYLLQVTYGPYPEDVKIFGPSVYVRNSSEPLTLTCSATNVNPEPTYTWSSVFCQTKNHGNTCTFTPAWPDDDGKVVTCAAESTIIGLSQRKANATFTVTFSYPPTQPVITGYNSSEILKDVGGIILTCTVSGGKPPVSNINFYCKRKDGSRINGTFDPSLSSNTLAIKKLQSNDNGTVCQCDSNHQWEPNRSLTFEASEILWVQSTLFYQTTDGKPKSDKHSGLPIVVVGGGVGGAVVLLIITIVIFGVVIHRRKAAEKKSMERPVSAEDEVLEEDFNTMYMNSEDDLTDVTRYTPAKAWPTALRISAIANADENKNNNDDHNADNTMQDHVGASFGYSLAAIRKPTAHRFAQVNTDMDDASPDYAYVDVSALPGSAIVYSKADGYSNVKDSRPGDLAESVVYAEPDGYSSAKESGPKVTGKAAKKPESLADAYAVVNWDGQRRHDRSAEYDHINQQPTKVPCDIYAQVDKSSKRRVQESLPNSQDVRPAKTEPETYAHGQKPIPSTKPKSPVKPKPNALSDHEEGQSQRQPEVTQEALKEDDYNILSHQPTPRDLDPQYSHIRDA